MRAREVAILITLIALVSFSYLAKEAVGQFVLPDRDRTVQYVNNLIDSYNALVNFNDKPRPDFESIKANFALYHDVGNSFKVVVVQSVPDRTDCVALIFIPIRADQPNIIMDYNHTLSGLLPGALYIAGNYTILKNMLFEYNDTIIQLNFIFVILSTDISGDYMTNSKNAAQYIHQEDEKQIPSETHISTQTTSQAQTTSLRTSPNLFIEIVSNPLSWITGAIAGIVTILVLYFGSIREFFRFVVDKEERKAVEEKAAKRIMTLFRRKKKVNEVKKQ